MTLIGPSNTKSALLKALAVIWIFTTFALIEAFGIHQRTVLDKQTYTFFEIVRMPLSYFWYWAALTPFVLYLSRRYPIRGNLVYRNGLVHLFWWVALSALHAGYRIPLNKIVYPWMPPLGKLELFSFYFWGNLMTNFLVYAVVLVLAHATTYFEALKARELRASQLEASLAEAKVQALTHQIQPHFLFNTFNAVMALMREDIDAAEDMLSDLSDLLRQTLKAAITDEVPLSDELSLLEPYVSIQKARFPSRLVFDIKVQPEARNALVPCMCLLTLVENAVRHGFEKQNDFGLIEVTAARIDDSISITVSDNGPGLTIPKNQVFSRGIGLSNTRDRLAHMYGEGSSLSVLERIPTGVQVIIRLPYRSSLEGTRQLVETGELS